MKRPVDPVAYKTSKTLEVIQPEIVTYSANVFNNCWRTSKSRIIAFALIFRNMCSMPNSTTSSSCIIQIDIFISYSMQTKYHSSRFVSISLGQPTPLRQSYSLLSLTVFSFGSIRSYFVFLWKPRIFSGIWCNCIDVL